MRIASLTLKRRSESFHLEWIIADWKIPDCRINLRQSDGFYNILRIYIHWHLEIIAQVHVHLCKQRIHFHSEQFSVLNLLLYCHRKVPGAASSIQQSDRFFVEQLEQMGYEIADRIWCQLMIRLYYFFFYVIKIGELERFPQSAVGTILFDTYESLSQCLQSCGIRIAHKQTVRLFYKCMINFFHLC